MVVSNEAEMPLFSTQAKDTKFHRKLQIPWFMSFHNSDGSEVILLKPTLFRIERQNTFCRKIDLPAFE